MFSTRRDRTPPPTLFEPLEPRTLLAFDPATFPAIADLVSADNTVVRMHTDLGAIDIELFDRTGPDGESASAAPITVANFLDYLRAGRIDLTMFHRSADISGNSIIDVLQGGGFSFTSAGGIEQVPAFDPIPNEFSNARSNTERTIAVAKLAGDPDSGTSQFFFNVEDNSAILDNPANNGGFTVFGRVVNDASWDVVLAIAALDTFVFADVLTDANGEIVRDLFGNVQPLVGGNPLSLALTDVPVISSPANPAPGQIRSTSLDEAVLVDIIDLEVIKPADSLLFFDTVFYLPEGWRDGNVTELVELLNLDATAGTMNHVQIVVRHETGSRDQVVFTGALAAAAHMRVRVVDASDPDVDLVRARSPYAYEVQSTRSLAAELVRTDNGKTAGETFVSLEPLNDAQRKRWTIPSGPALDGFVDAYLVFMNTTDQVASVTAVFRIDDSVNPARPITFSVDPYRRGGLHANEFENLPGGVRFSIVVVSDQPIVAMLSVARTDAQDSHTIATGIPLAGSTEGVLPGARIVSGSEAILSIYNSHPTTQIVQFSYVDETTAQPLLFINLPVAPRRFSFLELTAPNLGLPTDKFITITYSVFSAGIALGRPVSVDYVAINNGDRVATPFATRAARVIAFAGADFDEARAGTTFFETFSVFNPFAERDVNFRVTFQFSDGTSVVPPDRRLDPFGRTEVSVATLDAGSLQALLDKLEQGLTFGVSIAGTALPASVGELGLGAIVVQQTRRDPGTDRTFTTLGNYLLSTPLTDPAYDPGGIGN